MSNELHIHLHPGSIGTLDDMLGNFPYENGQTIIRVAEGLVVIDLAGADDTNIEQEWFLNGSEDVQSFYVVTDD